MATTPRSRGGALIGAVLLATVVALGTGAYFSGLLDGLLPGETDVTSGEETAGGKLTPAPPAAKETVPVPAKPLPEPAPVTEAKAPAPTDIAKPKLAEPVKPIALPEPPKAAMSAADWFKSFDGGPCFYASVANVSAPSPEVEGLASDGGIKAADIKDPELASDLFPKIRTEIEAQPNAAGITFAYFLFDR